jgi:protoporphyrinogen/coproporphyrinogen III oxidase
LTVPELDAEIVVVGGGIAGLAAAWRLRGRDVVLLEAAGRTGGRLCSERRGCYWLNWGAHVFSGPGSATGRLLDEVGVEAVPVPGELAALAMNGRLLTDGRVLSYPLRVPMPWASRLALVRAGARVRLAVRRYGAACAPVAGESDGALQQRVYDFMGDRSFAEFTGPLPPDADAMFRPTVMRSAGSPEQVSAGAGVGYFRLVWDRTSGLSRNILGGAATLTDAIGAELGSAVRTGSEVYEVIRERGGTVVRYHSGSGSGELRARHAVITTPAPVTARIAADLEPQTAAALRQVRYGPFVSAAFLTGETGPAPWDRCYAIATPNRSFNIFFNVTSIARSTEPERRPGSSIMVFAPAQLAARLLDLDDTAILERFTADADQIFPGFGAQVREAHVRRWPLGLAYCFPGRGRLQPALTRPLNQIWLAGDYLGTFYTETAITTGWRAANGILAQSGP